MNYFFSTGAERIAVIEDLRKKDIVFPVDWDIHRTRQRQSKIFRLSIHSPNHLLILSLVITLLLKHNPDERPTALELSQSSLLPPRLEDEYFKGALKMMSKLPGKGPGRYSCIAQPKPIPLTVRRFLQHSSIRILEACAGFSTIMMLNIQNTRR